MSYTNRIGFGAFVYQNDYNIVVLKGYDSWGSAVVETLNSINPKP